MVNGRRHRLWVERVRTLRRIAFDTNAVIYALEGGGPYAGLMEVPFTHMQQGTIQGVVSTIVELELIVKPLREQNQRALNQVQFFLQEMPNLSIRPMDRIVAWRAADIRARTRLALPDAVIVATALEERCDAIVGNDSAIASRIVGVPYLLLDDYTER